MMLREFHLLLEFSFFRFLCGFWGGELDGRTAVLSSCKRVPAFWTRLHSCMQDGDVRVACVHNTGFALSPNGFCFEINVRIKSGRDGNTLRPTPANTTRDFLELLTKNSYIPPFVCCGGTMVCIYMYVCTP